MKRVLVLGCTGSIGKSSLDIIHNMKDDFIVCGLQAHSNSEELSKLSKRFNCPTLLSSKDAIIIRLSLPKVKVIWLRKHLNLKGNGIL